MVFLFSLLVLKNLTKSRCVAEILQIREILLFVATNLAFLFVWIVQRKLEKD